MNEKVLNLLQLCLTAKEHDVPIWFSWSPHVGNVNIYALKEGWEDIHQDEAPEREFTCNIYIDWEDAERQIAEAERSIMDLIEERGK
jgi:hypothetical protein